MAGTTSSATIRITGIEALKAKFDQLSDDAGGTKVRAALRAGGMVVMNAAKANAPVLTGNLRRSIAIVDGPGPQEITIGTDVEYAPFVEFGTSKMAAQPYLRPAIDENHDAVIGAIEDALSALLLSGGVGGALGGGGLGGLLP